MSPSLQFYPLVLLILLPFLQQTVSPSPTKIPILSPFHKHALISRKVDKSLNSLADSHDFKKHYYKQTLDHFNYVPQSYANFTQKYVVNSKYWGGPNSSSPIFAYLGAEQPLDAEVISYIGIINDNAPHFKALSVFLEHRFYGESAPFGKMKKAMKNKRVRGYFNSAQALADYAEILLHIKHKFSAHTSPIIVVGGSYGGMLACWFRLKYPHIALGALASSAPVLYFDNIISPQNGYFSVVTNDFQEASQSCYQTIKESWAEIDWVASIPGGLSILTQRFKFCSQLSSSDELKEFLVGMYAEAAQYNYPAEYVRKICEGIDGAPPGTDVIGRIVAGVVAFSGNWTCNDTIAEDDYSSEVFMGWSWQSCSEMVMPIGIGENATMFQPSPFNLTQFIEGCEESYGVSPRPHWITTYYGGHDIKMDLKRFGSNIIFSNGLQDPYSSGGVLEDINESMVAVTTLNGSHCVDLPSASESDPEWLITQRKIELETFQGWLSTYYAHLDASNLKISNPKS